jgi:hypothetical protein
MARLARMASPREVPAIAGDVLKGSVGRAGALLAGGMQGAAATVQLGERLAANLERALELHIRTLELAQPLVAALTKAVEDGLLDDLRVALRAVDAGASLTEQMSRQLATMNAMLETVDRMVGQMASVTPLGAIPGVGRALGMVPAPFGRHPAGPAAGSSRPPEPRSGDDAVDR